VSIKLTSNVPTRSVGSPIGHNNGQRSRYWLRTLDENRELQTYALTSHVYTLPSNRFLTFTKGRNAKAYDRRLDKGSWERLGSKFDLHHLGKQIYVHNLGESWTHWALSGIGKVDIINS